jgi:aspartyl-tRNA(Asn)/glutamyl-tRNA(Gln) amidotransferase subunit C
MAKINNELVDKIAHLARLEFENEAKEEIKNDMERMLAFVEKLNEINTDNIEPLVYMNPETNKLREDIAIQTVTHKEGLLNAPKHDTDYFKVPKVVENKG